MLTGAGLCSRNQLRKADILRKVTFNYSPGDKPVQADGLWSRHCLSWSKQILAALSGKRPPPRRPTGFQVASFSYMG